MWDLTILAQNVIVYTEAGKYSEHWLPRPSLPLKLEKYIGL